MVTINHSQSFIAKCLTINTSRLCRRSWTWSSVFFLDTFPTTLVFTPAWGLREEFQSGRTLLPLCQVWPPPWLLPTPTPLISRGKIKHSVIQNVKFVFVFCLLVNRIDVRCSCFFKKYAFVFCRFVGESLSLAKAEAEALNDSGYSTPSKRARPSPDVTGTEAGVPNNLVKELASGYERLYLCRPGSLEESYEKGLKPPHRNSLQKYMSAINASPGWSRSISKQLERVGNFRKKASSPIMEVDLCDDED